MNRRFLSLLLSFCMVITMLPVSVMAKETDTTGGTNEEIIAFAPLEESEISVAVGTPAEDLNLPETLNATVRPITDSGESEESEMDIPVTWTSPDYDMGTEGTYAFTPEIEGYTVSAELPEMKVMVQAARGMLLMVPAAPTQARWGEAGANGEEPTSWTTGTLSDAITYANGTDSNTYIQLLADIDSVNHTNWPLTFAADKTTILDLNGHDIDRGLTAATQYGNVITVEGALTITDTSDVENQGKITGGYNSTQADDSGGGILMKRGTLTLAGGNIVGNKSIGWGGGVKNEGGTFRMTGGKISGNIANYDGDSVGNFNNCGGGVYIGGSFTMTGGEISGNSVCGSGNSRKGGGVFFYRNVTLGNTAIIQGNKSGCTYSVPNGTSVGTVSGGITDNVYLRSGTTISVAPQLTSGAYVGITTQTAPTPDVPVSIVNTGSDYLHSDNANYEVVNTQLWLRSATPATDTPSVAKTSAEQASVSFIMTTAPAGEYKVYADNSTTTEHDAVSASLNGSTLTLTHASDIPAGTYYVSVTESDQPESTRLALTVEEYVPTPTYLLTVNPNGGIGGSTGGSYTAGTSIPINAGTRANYTFSGWTSSAGGTFGNPTSATTTFIMPANGVTITANWSYNGSETGGETGGGGSSSGSSGGSSGESSGESSGGSSSHNSGSSAQNNTSPVIVIPPAPDKPNSPTQGETKVTGTTDRNGNVAVKITEKTVTDAYNNALAAARKNGNEQNGIAIVLHTNTGNKTASNVTVNLPKAVQDTIIEKKIVNTIVVVDNPNIHICMDLGTVQAINKQAQSDVNITATRTNNNLTGEAKKTIGSRPLFHLSVNYGNGKQIQDFGAGSVTVTIPYTLSANERAGNIHAVYVDESGKPQWLANSVYDSRKKVLCFKTNHFSTYGIGYKEVNTGFADIANHWAKEEIEFAVSRGLLSGTSATTFSPDTAATRGVFVTALGRLANVDVSSYNMSYIEWANKNGILTGTNGTFSPDQSITREQMAVIMQNYAKAIGFTLPKVYAESTFADSAKISANAKDTIKQMQMAGVIRSKNGNLFNPQGILTRAETSAILRRFAELTISIDAMQGWTKNDSGKWMYYENGQPVTGTKDIDGTTYTFDQYGVVADVPKNLKYATYTVKKGDCFWLIARKLGCTMSEIEQLNTKNRYAIIYPREVLRVPLK